MDMAVGLALAFLLLPLLVSIGQVPGENESWLVRFVMRQVFCRTEHGLRLSHRSFLLPECLRCLFYPAP